MQIKTRAKLISQEASKTRRRKTAVEWARYYYNYYDLEFNLRRWFRLCKVDENLAFYIFGR